MSRAITVGNGNLLVGLDCRGQVRDLYYPFVGETSHVSGASGSFVHRIGVFVDNEITWFDDESWDIVIGSSEETAIGVMVAINEKIGIKIETRDVVHNEQNIFIRNFSVTNLKAEEREVKLFISQQFRISESRRGDTAFYDPRVKSIIHYKAKIVFLINAFVGNRQFSDYSIGVFGIEGREGTYFDAFDGVLEKNPIEHGSVDSVIGLDFSLDAKETKDAYYWIVCGESIPVVHTLDEYVIKERPERLIKTTEAYWQAWLGKEARDLSNISKPLQNLYNRSQVIMRVHTDNRGGIIASSDTDVLHHGRDTYGYVWPRDGAFVALAFDVTGHDDVVQRFYSFIADLIEVDGYLMHKYLTSGCLGSSWHPWLQNGEPKLPIQEDETASIIFTLWKHYEKSRDLEFIESLYNSFIEPAARFLSEYIEPSTGLPQASYDLWEEKYGTSTYTSASVFGGLMAASRFAFILGKEEDARVYQAIAQRIKGSIKEFLFDNELGIFVKQVIHSKEDELIFDKTIDVSSLYGLILFDVFDIDDFKIEKMAEAVINKLQVNAESRGFIRYENDQYYRMQDANSSNPWVITTLWMSRYFIKKAKKLKDLEKPLEFLEWTCSSASAGGVLSEQIHPNTKKHLSTSPLVWSHAEFVLAVDEYLNKYEELKGL